MRLQFACYLTLLVIVPGISWGAEGPDLSVPNLTPNLSAITYKDVVRERAISRAWKLSLVPLIASQSLDAASSYGMRELNPALANSNGQFGMKSAAIKFSAVGALIGVEYLVIRKHPGAAKAFAKVNWAAGIVTAGFAAHNFAIR